MSKPTRPTDKPADAPAASPREAAVLRSGRLRVTQRDLEMYAALVGVPQALLIPGEPTVRAEESGSATVTATATARAWQSLTHSVGGFTVRLARPDLSSWVRRVSGHARMQLHQARLRLTSPNNKPRRERSNP
jgi:hypothetical protein